MSLGVVGFSVFLYIQSRYVLAVVRYLRNTTWIEGRVTVLACAASPGLVADGGDCDERDASVSPDAPERCNERDDDCDGTIDEDDAIDAPS